MEEVAVVRTVGRECANRVMLIETLPLGQQFNATKPAALANHIEFPNCSTMTLGSSISVIFSV